MRLITVTRCLAIGLLAMGAIGLSGCNGKTTSDGAKTTTASDVDHSHGAGGASSTVYRRVNAPDAIQLWSPNSKRPETGARNTIAQSRSVSSAVQSDSRNLPRLTKQKPDTSHQNLLNRSSTNHCKIAVLRRSPKCRILHDSKAKLMFFFHPMKGF